MEIVIFYTIIGTLAYLFFGLCVYTIICDTSAYKQEINGFAIFLCIVFFWFLAIPYYAVEIWKNS